MRKIIGSGTPKGAASAGDAVLLLVLTPDGAILLLMTALVDDMAICLAIVILPHLVAVYALTLVDWEIDG